MEIVEVDGLRLPRTLIDDYKRVRSQDGDTFLATILLDTDPARDDDLRCPNCGGMRGRGKLYAPTGGRCGPYHAGGTTHTRGVSYPLRRQMQAYDCPICAEESYRSAFWERCGVPEPDELLKADVWHVKGREEMVQAAQQAVSDWTTNGPANWLTLVGPYGSGKTFLAQRAVCQCVAANIEATYVLAKQLGRLVTDAIEQEMVTPDQALDRYRRIPVLVIDQLDWLRQQTSSGQLTFVMEHLINLLDERYQQRHRQATVLVVNRDWWLAKGGELAPIVSRAMEGVVAETEVPNLRMLAREAAVT